MHLEDLAVCLYLKFQRLSVLKYLTDMFDQLFRLFAKDGAVRIYLISKQVLSLRTQCTSPGWLPAEPLIGGAIKSAGAVNAVSSVLDQGGCVHLYTPQMQV